MINTISHKKRNSIVPKLLLALAIMIMLSGCGLLQSSTSPIDPKNPITVTVWHYYNAQTKEKFDQLVAEFNDTIGIEKGIVIDALSQGDVHQLANAVFDAANKKIGSKPVPDIFAAYPDNAFRVNKLVELVDMEHYFTKEEILAYRQDFINTERFGEDDALKIIPVAKSTENLFLNYTYWDHFSSETGVSIDSLSTWEGLLETAARYYEWTDAQTPELNDGKAFFSLDSPSNFMLIATMQLGEPLYSYDEQQVTLHFPEPVARKIWDHFYVPYLKGFYEKTGRFSSDDAKVGTIIAYTGSTAGAGYFPKEVTVSQDEVHPIVNMALPFPYFKDGTPYAIHQGAGMSIVKSDKAREYAATEFLKWFTSVEQNVSFAISTAYFPAKNEALSENVLISALNEENSDTPANAAITNSIQTTVAMLDQYSLYSNKPFDGSFEMRQLLDNSLFNRVQIDRNLLNERIANGENRVDIVNELVSDSNFQLWYQAFLQESMDIIN